MYLLHHKKNDIYANISLLLSYSEAGLDWDKKSALAFFWSRRPTSTSNYIYIYICIYIFKKNMYRPDSASDHRENARYARLPVQPCSEVTVATQSGPYPAQMITAVNRSSPYPDQMVDHHLETTSTALNVSGDQGT